MDQQFFLHPMLKVNFGFPLASRRKHGSHQWYVNLLLQLLCLSFMNTYPKVQKNIILINFDWNYPQLFIRIIHIDKNWLESLYWNLRYVYCLTWQYFVWNRCNWSLEMRDFMFFVKVRSEKKFNILYNLRNFFANISFYDLWKLLESYKKLDPTKVHFPLFFLWLLGLCLTQLISLTFPLN